VAKLPVSPAQDEFDARIRAELRSIPVPAGLRKRILAQSRPGNVIHWEFWRPSIAIAASVALLAVGLVFFMRRPAEDRSFSGFQTRMAAFAVRQYSMDVLTRDFTVLRDHFTRRGTPASLQLPSALRSTPLKGGASLAWQGRPVSMICFDGPDSKTLYLFVTDSADLGGTPPGPNISKTKGLATASWTRDGKAYFLAADLPESQLQSYTTGN
jgi:hypothetical protein